MRSIRVPRSALIAGIAGGLALIATVELVPINSARFSLFDRDDTLQSEVALGQAVYQVHCAICHGRYLEGQVSWQTPMANGRMPAPPHNASGHTWHHTDQMLVGIVKNGLKPYAGENYESDMPAFAGTLNEKQIETVVAYIKSTWPEREREYQTAITRQAKGLSGPP